MKLLRREKVIAEKKVEKFFFLPNYIPLIIHKLHNRCFKYIIDILNYIIDVLNKVIA